MRHIPNLFTLLNLVFGFMAIIVTLQNGITIQYTEDASQFIDVTENLVLASVYIAIAACIDFLDGFVARLMRASSELGKQLDSLADVVSFGVAPGMIVYQFLRLSWAKEASGIDVYWGLLLPAVLIPLAAAYRLGRFNLDRSQEYGFKGVPVPAAGLLIASFPLIYWFSGNETAISLLMNQWVLYAVILLVSGLMVSRIPMMAFKFKERSIPANLPQVMLVVIAVVATLSLKWIAVPVIFLSYIILSLIFKKKT
ncbi:MAG TPA: CDP-alcohol phosphatidyltransferase family protein [Ferruginibacter sp.]|nr:CDP-alcohol phosphatidyltransferase family protein [Ferruginibacter sp.]HRN92559.1 CDP-alcohol phosphatidyltransferase family protein [Ferruginibacter sp.]HRO06287.1 CDP-alcohol phosphatidyltransferase family protein [Ferruginibacter sp.]HRO96768.1 CDP-alcohol phosphatidyltransferase family protein [Ferruginibacter sp.]HRP49817.1 CDP-alcohol phosphatidyltransferase family protein [Ferruginibacter sp.]